MRRALTACATLWLAIASAVLEARADETPFPEELAFPDQAAALRPAGMIEVGTTFGVSAQNDREYGYREQLYVLMVDARVPIDALILELSVTNLFFDLELIDYGIVNEGLFHAFGNPRIGASWRAQYDGWRIEVGGALNAPYRADSTLEPLYIDLGGGEAFIYVPEPDRFQRFRGGWNAFQLAPDRFAIVAHARVEIDLVREVVIGIEVDVPLVFDLGRGEAAVVPQIAIEAAYRLGYCLAGARLQGVTVYDWSYGAVFLVEPFVRLVAVGRDAVAPFGALSAQFTLGPDQPESFSRGEYGRGGLFALKLAGGFLF